MTHQILTTARFPVECPSNPARPKAVHSDPRDDIVKHLGPMRAFALSLIRDRARADDLVQDSVVKAWTTIGKLEPGSNMRVWLFTILRNSFLSERRKTAGEIVGDCARGERIEVEPDQDGIFAPADFRRAFDTLPDEQREALILVGAEGFSYQEAAAICGCSIGTVKSRADRGRHRLAVILSIEQGESLGIADRANVSAIGANSWA